MRIIRRCFIASALFVFSICSFVSIAHAQTDIEGGLIVGNQNNKWNIAGSPYILKGNIFVPKGITFTIEEGVEVGALSGQTTVIDGAGDINILGTKEKPVILNHVGIIAKHDSNMKITYASIDSLMGVKVLSAHATISSTTIQRAIEGVYIFASDVRIDGSVIEHNTSGIRIHNHEGDVAVGDSDFFGVGGIGNAFEDIPTGLVVIRNSTFLNNSSGAIDNTSTTTVDARYNWWGSPDGPSVSISGELYGLVDYVPWLTHDPQISQCCSNVLFIPGLEATRLYSTSSGSTKKLWEPLYNSDVKKLYLDSTGASIDPTIYSGTPIDKALGIYSVYNSFIKLLNSLEKKDVFNEWKSFGYDWRKSIPEIVLGVEKKATTTESLFDVVHNLAHRSKTGKVNIISHSNGGLVAAYLVNILSEKGESGLIDTVINVATPTLGTPEALAALLHGSGQSIAKGLILKESIARGLALNMASAYSLLPSSLYFTKILTPTIIFGSGKNLVDSSTKQSAFIASSTNLILNASAQSLHSVLDSFLWPNNIVHWAITGWNIPTTKTVQYTDKTSCSLVVFRRKCKTSVEHEARMTSMGDGTVVTPSASHGTDNVISLDLAKISKSEGKKTVHSNILESSTTQEVIRKILSGEASSTASLSGSSGVSVGEPDYSKEATFIVIRSKGPGGLHVYDSQGHHTGATSTLPGAGSDVVVYDDDIPGSTYSFSPNSLESRVNIPSDDSYSVVVRGSSIGFVDLSVQTIRNGEVLNTTSFTDIPMTPLVSASTTVASTTIASSTQILNIDVGVGANLGTTTVITMNPGTTLDPQISLDTFRLYFEESRISTSTNSSLTNSCTIW